MTSYDHDTTRLAETYDRVSNSQYDGGKRLIEMLGIKADDRVLDVGCGTGRLACWIAECVGPSGKVAGIDPLAQRIAIARGRNRDVHFEIGSAEDLSCFPDMSFDVVSLNAVFHWIADKSKALAEIYRVLRPGGRLGVTTTPKELRLAATLPIVCASVLSQPPYAEAIQPAALEMLDRHITTTEALALLAEHQFELVELHVVRRMQVLRSGQDVIDFAESSSFGNLLSLVPDRLQTSLSKDLATAFEKGNQGGEILLHQFVMLFIAERGRDPRRSEEPSS
jgi:arsenite methyltransferase